MCDPGRKVVDIASKGVGDCVFIITASENEALGPDLDTEEDGEGCDVIPSANTPY